MFYSLLYITSAFPRCQTQFSRYHLGLSFSLLFYHSAFHSHSWNHTPLSPYILQYIDGWGSLSDLILVAQGSCLTSCHCCTQLSFNISFKLALLVHYSNNYKVRETYFGHGLNFVYQLWLLWNKFLSKSVLSCKLCFSHKRQFKKQKWEELLCDQRITGDLASKETTSWS